MSQDQTNAIALPTGVQSTSLTTQQAADLLKSGDYLAYVVVTTGNSTAVKEEKVKMGVVAVVVNQQYIELGKEVPMVVIAERPKAMRFGDTILSYFDMNSAEFKKVQEDAKIPNSQAAAGLEFLVWIPGVGDNGMFAGLFCGNASMKKEAIQIRQYLGGKAISLKVKLAQNARYSWHTGVCAPHTSPIGSQPDPDELAEELKKFTNPKSSTVEKADAQPTRAR